LGFLSGRLFFFKKAGQALKNFKEEQVMKNYLNSDYALNKYSKGIVYRFADGIREVTLADYLAENPGKTKADFQALKEFSDRDYARQARKANAQTKKNSTLSDVMETEASPEEVLIAELDAQEEADHRERRVVVAQKALDKLTEIQRRRYLMYHVEGLTLREIADAEGANFKTVYESLQAADKKIKKILRALKKYPHKTPSKVHWVRGIASRFFSRRTLTNTAATISKPSYRIKHRVLHSVCCARGHPATQA
jgi:predicted DNA-binding protein YlxM (UPF0122 family)